MKSHVRVSLLALFAGSLLAVSAPAAQAAFGIESLFASNCQEGATCTASSTEGNHSEIFTQAAGHPPQGVTDFTIKHHVIQTVPFTAEAPEGNVKNIRTDVGPGESTNPEAVTKCSVANFTGTPIEPAPGLHAFTAPTCPGSEIGTNVVHVVLEPAPGVFKNYVLEGKMYNLEQPEGMASYFGIALSLEPVLGAPGAYVHTFLEGHIEWGAEAAGTGKADYHDVYEIKNVTPGLISSRITFKGNIGTGGFLTLPSSCTGTGPQTTTTLHVETYEGASEKIGYSGPLGSEGCNGLPPFTAVPFAPTFSLAPQTTQQDQPDGVTTELGLPHDPNPEHVDSSQLKTASVTLPEGLTLNPSAANGLQACRPKQIGIKTKNPVMCPEASKIGTVALNVPDLPEGSLVGNMYLGQNENTKGEAEPIAGPPYTMYIDAESARYGVSVRLKGSVVPNETTGRLTATFAENPEQPFSKLVMSFTGGPKAVLANPLACGMGTTETSFSPYTGQPAVLGAGPFTITGCPSPLPFSLSQSTANLAPGNAGANTSFAFNLERADGQQYLEKVKTVLAPGLVGKIAGVPLCGEPQAATGECPVASQVGVATVKAGAGSAPYEFPGFVYLTGPYNGAPYGLAIVVPAVAGPFSLGNVVTRATINVEPNYPNRVAVASVLPTIFKGIPLRVKNINLNINRQGYLINPTNCSMFATESALTSTLGATQSLSSPFQVGNCNALALKPSFKSATSAKTSKALGASLETTLNQGAGQTNIKSVLVQLPKQLPSRLTTLQKACPAAVFEANPYNCPSGAFVGGVRANTPVLPDKMKGPAVLVSHANAAFPDLDLVLEADGVRVILVGNTNIKNSITSTNFATLPDVPVSSITVNLPIGAHSAVTANGNVCANQLSMPTEITGQNGFKVKQNTKMRVTGCGVRIVGEKTVGNTAYITVQTFEAGRISGSGPNVRTTYRYLGRAEKTATLKVALSNRGRSRGRPLRVRLRVGFVPKKHGAAKSAATRTVTFR
ncbi:MAG: hypothetical protein ACHQCH_05950 [Solirubrobacterales bacterium]